MHSTRDLAVFTPDRETEGFKTTCRRQLTILGAPRRISASRTHHACPSIHPDDEPTCSLVAAVPRPPQVKRTERPIAAACVVVAALTAGGVYIRPLWLRGLLSRQPELVELVASMPERPMEGRLTGGFA